MSKNNTYCCVFGCKSIGARRRNNISFHKFPRKGKTTISFANSLGIMEVLDRRKIWENVLVLQKEASDYLRVCSLHFQKDDYHSAGCYDKRYLLDTAVPSTNLPVRSFTEGRNTDKNNVNTARKIRIINRKLEEKNKETQHNNTADKKALDSNNVCFEFIELKTEPRTEEILKVDD